MVLNSPSFRRYQGFLLVMIVGSTLLICGCGKKDSTVASKKAQAQVESTGTLPVLEQNTAFLNYKPEWANNSDEPANSFWRPTDDGLQPPPAGTPESQPLD